MRGARGGRENQNQRQSARGKKKGKINPGNERKKVKKEGARGGNLNKNFSQRLNLDG